MNAFYLALLTAVVWGIVPIIEKAGLSKIAPLSGLLIRCAGVLIGAGILIIFNTRLLKDALKADIKTVILLVLGGFLASIVGQMLFYNALKQGEASKMVPIAGIYPLVSFLIAVMFLGEAVTPLKVAGMVLIVLGIFFLR
jgi:transporter family protein